MRWTTGRYLSWGRGRNSSRLDQQVEALISDEIETLSPSERSIDEIVINACTKAIKRFCRRQLGKNPTILIHSIRTDLEE